LRCQVGRRCGRHIALRARAQGHGDHVARNALVVAHAGIEAFGEHIDEGVVGGDFERDARVRRQEAACQRRQHALRHDDRHVQPQRAGGAVAKAVERVERAGNVVERGRYALQQPLPGLGGRHAARGAVEQAHAHLCLQPAHGFAQRGGRHAAQRGRAAKAACARHRHEGAEVGEVGVGHGGVPQWG
jgi:hypothetical protein